MLKGILQSDLFYCNHLGVSESDARDIMAFSVRDSSGEGLVSYIQHYAFPDEESGIMRTYVVRDIRSLELVAYFSLKAGLISLNEVQTKDGAVFDTLPGVELANFAVNNTYIHRHPNLKGVGTVIFDKFILPIVTDTAERIGIKLIYIFALPFEQLLRRYQQYGFQRLESPYEDELHKRLKPQYDEGCIFMYQML